MTAIRWALHPLTPALALLVACLGAGVAGTASMLALVEIGRAHV